MSSFNQAENVPEPLRAAVAEGRLGHGLLLYGERMSAIRNCAHPLAWALICESPAAGVACGVCPACQLLAFNSHPDFIELCPEQSGRNILVAQVREMIEFLTLSTHRGRGKVALIDPAELLNISAANALLKSLEEPPPHRHIMLLSSHPEELPATLRSRCQRFFIPCSEAAPVNPLRAEIERDWQALLESQSLPVELAAQWRQHDLPELLNELSALLAERARRSDSRFQARVWLLCYDEVARLQEEVRRRLNPSQQLSLEALLIRCARFWR